MGRVHLPFQWEYCAYDNSLQSSTGVNLPTIHISELVTLVTGHICATGGLDSYDPHKYQNATVAISLFLLVDFYFGTYMDVHAD